MKTNMFILRSNDKVNFDNIDIRDYKYKIREESREVEEAICSLRRGYETDEKVERIAEELLDVIQTCIQGLFILYKDYGLDVFRSIDIHNAKLFSRGWKFLKKVFIDF